MKSYLYIITLFFLSLIYNNTYAQKMQIWKEDFSDTTIINKGYSGENENVIGITKWSIDVSNCILSDELDYIKVVSTSAGRMEARDIDGEAIFYTQKIDVSNFNDIDLSVSIGEVGSSSNINKYAKIYIKIDDKEEYLVETNAEGIGNWGLIVAEEKNVNASSVQIIVRLNNPNSGDKVYIDNIILMGNAKQVMTDNISMVKKSSTQPNNKNILVSNLTYNNSFEVFRFNIDETTDTSDNLPTRVATIKILNKHPDKEFSWSEHLSSFYLKSDGNIINFESMHFDDDSIKFSFTNDQLNIIANSNKDISLFTYLKNEILIDNSTIQLFIPKENHSFTTLSSSSKFSSVFIEDIISHISSVQIIADTLLFNNLPSEIYRSQPFNVIISATDAYGNIDKSATSEVVLSLASGQGVLSSESSLTKSLSQGLVEFTDLKYSGTGEFSIKANSDLGDFISNNIMANSVNTSFAKASTWQATETNIAADKYSQHEEKPIFHFLLEDVGDDIYSTYVTKFRLNASTENTIDWKSSIDTFKIYADGELLSPTILISNAYATFTFSDSIEILNATSKEISVSAVFKSGKLIQGEKLGISIDTAHKYWQISDQGSNIVDHFPAEITSQLFQIEVNADRLSFSSFPKELSYSQQFSVSVSATDAYANIDKSATSEVVLSLASGKGTLISDASLTKPLSQGLVEFTDLKYSGTGEYSLKASSDLGDFISNNIMANSVNTSFAKASTWQATETNIAAEKYSQHEEKPIFHFVLEDVGDDIYSTYVTKFRLNASTENTIDWKSSIDTFKIYADGELLSPTILISNAYATFTFATSIEIFNATSKEISVSAVFKSGKLIQGEKLGISIDTSHKYWQISDQGSNIVDHFPAEITSQLFQIEVNADRLSFSDLPKRVSFQQVFDVSFIITDEFGNRSNRVYDNISLKLMSGEGSLDSYQLVTFYKTGEYAFKDIMYSNADNFTLLIEHPDLESILSSNISSCDSDSYVSTLPVDVKNISSLTVDKENAISVFRFSLNDTGIHDNLSSIIKSIKFDKQISDNSFPWKSTLAGAVMIYEGKVVASTKNISDSQIVFNSLNNIVKINNASSKTYDLAIYFYESQLIDSSIFKCSINENNINTSIVGSSFINSDTKLQSQPHSLDVEASRLSFSNYMFANDNSDMPFKIFAVDKFQNIDLDYTHDFIIRDKTDSVYYKGSINKGESEFNIKHKFNPKIKFYIEDNNLSTDSTIIYSHKHNAFIDDNFEDNDISSWNNIKDWAISSYRAINGGNSLTHNLTSAIGDSYISHILPNLQVNRGAIHWSFNFATSDFSPSSSNKFSFFLLADNADILKSKSAFVLGVNKGKLNNLLSFWYYHNGEYYLLSESNILIKSNQTISADITYNSNGKWILKYNRLGDELNYSKQPEVDYKIPFTSEKYFFGCSISISSPSYAGSISVDNVKVESVSLPAFVESYSVNEIGNINVFFSKILDPHANGIIDMKNNKGEDLSFKTQIKDSTIIIIPKEQLRTGKYFISISDVIDLDGNASYEEDIMINYENEINTYDIVVNELMVDPSPSIILPEYEYIELYNRTKHPVDLSNIFMLVGDKEIMLDNYFLNANSYVYICSKQSLGLISEYTNVMALDKFPSMNNTQGIIKLFSNKKVLLDSINYSLDWYRNKEKQNGGFSLERIDPDNNSWQQANWMASIDRKGGTPGEKNSVFKNNPDTKGPILLNAEFIDNKTLILSFNEALDPVNSIRKTNFILSTSSVKQATLSENNKDIILQFHDEIPPSSELKITMSDNIKDLLNHPWQEKDVFVVLADIALPKDIIINEVLFNPYPNAYDFVELVNVSDKIFNLNNMFIANRDELYNVNQKYIVSDNNYFLYPKQYVLITKDTTDIKHLYSYYQEDSFLQIKQMPSLPDKQGRILVLNINDILIDEFAYNQDMHSKLLSSLSGVSLERISLYKETNTVANWQSAAQSHNFATPGMKNSAQESIPNPTDRVSVSPEIFIPNNDGIDDYMYIHFNLKQGEYAVNIRIYDKNGYEIRNLVNNYTISTKAEMRWDGISNNNELSPLGIYIIYIELLDLKGNVEVFKRICVLGCK